MKILTTLTLIAIIFSAAACGADSATLSGENYGNLLDTVGGLTLTQKKHSYAWGESECSTCHNFNNIHLVDRTGTGIDMAAIRDIVFSDGLSSCATCHGTNGVE